MRRRHSATLGLCAVLLLAAAAHADPSDPYESDRGGLLVPGGYPIFINSSAPLSSQPLTPVEIPKNAILEGKVFGQGCQFAISAPITLAYNATKLSAAFGSGGYVKAMKQIKHKNPDIKGIYDEMIDEHSLSILGVFQYLCVEVHARAYTLPASPGANGKS